LTGHFITVDGFPLLTKHTGSPALSSKNKKHLPARFTTKVLWMNVKGLTFLKVPSKIHIGWKNEYSTEASIAFFCQCLLDDVVQANPELQGLNLTFVPELSAFGDKADIWVLALHGRPIGAIEIKKPGVGVMDSSWVAGQILDYMTRIRSFHGQDNVFGIVSTYTEWRVCWLKVRNYVSAAVHTDSLQT